MVRKKSNPEKFKNYEVNTKNRKEIQKSLACHNRQKSAGTLIKPHRVCKTYTSKRHRFQAKYLGIFLTNTRNSEDDTTVGKTRVVTDACNNKNKKVWQVVAFIAKKHYYNDRLYLVDNSINAGDTIRITVGNNLSKRIKTFNMNTELI